ncbi:MAG TPA: hypothetical protein VFY64_01835, partial [Nitrososphaeraceae archaeon]|nr:hypothetical protein [Nitrososphaeraceae archaeon]
TVGKHLVISIIINTTNTFSIPLIFCALSTSTCVEHHDDPPYVLAAIGSFSSWNRRIESAAALFFLRSSTRFFSNHIQDPCFYYYQV